MASLLLVGPLLPANATTTSFLVLSSDLNHSYARILNLFQIEATIENSFFLLHINSNLTTGTNSAHLVSANF